MKSEDLEFLNLNESYFDFDNEKLKNNLVI